MMREKLTLQNCPTQEQLKTELTRVNKIVRFLKITKRTLYSLMVVASVAVLVATIWMPVLQIFGASMTPTLGEGDIVITVKGKSFSPGDLVCFYSGNQLLVKRYIAGSGQWVDIDQSGNVYINSSLLEEPYVYEKAIGETDIDYPYQVPENRIFVLGDHRSTSLDSRSTSIGCVASEQIVGKIIFRLWPLNGFGRAG